VTDRIKGFIVTLARDTREDDVMATKKALEQIKGVIDVTGLVTEPSDHMNRARVRTELLEKLIKVVQEEE
jgi:hypothetical protein